MMNEEQGAATTKDETSLSQDPNGVVQDYLDEMLMDDWLQDSDSEADVPHQNVLETTHDTQPSCEPESTSEFSTEEPHTQSIPSQESSISQSKSQSKKILSQSINTSTNADVEPIADSLNSSSSVTAMAEESFQNRMQSLMEQVKSAPESLFDDPVFEPSQRVVDTYSSLPKMELPSVVEDIEDVEDLVVPSADLEDNNSGGQTVSVDPDVSHESEPTEGAPSTEPSIAPSSIAPSISPRPEVVSELFQPELHWKEAPFNSLIFKVDGLKLAVPMILLGTIHPIDENLTEIFGQAHWFMGLLKVGNKTVKVADTRKIVMPDRAVKHVDHPYKYVIQIQGSDWGLACHEVSFSQLIDPDQVRWRNANRLRRPWVAGTIREEMCALIDVTELEKAMIASPDQFND